MSIKYCEFLNSDKISDVRYAKELQTKTNGKSGYEVISHIDRVKPYYDFDFIAGNKIDEKLEFKTYNLCKDILHIFYPNSSIYTYKASRMVKNDYKISFHFIVDDIYFDNKSEISQNEIFDEFVYADRKQQLFRLPLTFKDDLITRKLDFDSRLLYVTDFSDFNQLIYSHSIKSSIYKASIITNIEGCKMQNKQLCVDNFPKNNSYIDHIKKILDSKTYINKCNCKSQSCIDINSQLTELFKDDDNLKIYLAILQSKYDRILVVSDNYKEDVIVRYGKDNCVKDKIYNPKCDNDKFNLQNENDRDNGIYGNKIYRKKIAPLDFRLRHRA